MRRGVLPVDLIDGSLKTMNTTTKKEKNGPQDPMTQDSVKETLLSALYQIS